MPRFDPSGHFGNCSPGKTLTRRIFLFNTLDNSWDAIVVGAGPAGAVSALRLAREGWRVLLLERCAWPRHKVCGGCVNADALRSLRSLNVHLQTPSPLHSCVIRLHQQTVTVPLDGGVAIERATLDRQLVDVATAAGVTFLDRASAVIQPRNNGQRSVRVERDGVRRMLTARWVLACDGISGSSLTDESWANWTVANDSRIGVATTIRDDQLADREIYLRVGDGGYVGLVRIDADTVHVAAAFDLAACKSAGSPARLAARILERPSLAGEKWHGIGRLTRHRQQLAAPGVLAIGDACGYVEPFTGQGIAWAIRAAIEATTLLLTDEIRAVEQWNDRHRKTVGRSQRGCHAVRYSLRHPAIGTAAVAALSIYPAAWNHLNRWIA